MTTFIARIFFISTSILLLMLAMNVKAEESLGMLNSTRLIFNGENQKVSMPVYNNTKAHYLFHAQILDAKTGRYSDDFITSPEIVQLGPGQTKDIQVIRLKNHMPTDRETLYYISGHFLPSSKDFKQNNSESSLDFSYEAQMKMFYRPVGIKASFDAIDDSYKKIIFSKSNDKLFIKNESPYYFTFHSLSLDDVEIEIPDQVRMVEPFGKGKIDLPNKATSEITWTLINDGGFWTKPETKKLIENDK